MYFKSNFPKTAFFLLFLVFVWACNAPKTKNEEQPIHEIVEKEPPKLAYNLIPIDSFEIKTNKIKKNENLSHILINQGISSEQIYQITEFKDTFDVRKIRKGHFYKMFFTKDSTPKLAYFVYEHTLTEYVLIKFNENLEVLIGEKPTEIIKKTASGTIRSNLWDAMKENNINPLIANELSEIYAWNIDFFGLQKGDEFFIIYEERFLDDSISTGIERIYATLFKHQKEKFYAFYFEQNNRGSYFDENANSLRRAFLKAPLKYSRISSHFSKSRFHPILKIYRPHMGVDYAAPAGTPIFSVGDGLIIKKGYQKKGAGNYLKIKHNSVYTTQYAHLLKFAKGIKKGTRVKQGDLIGYVGSTGYSTGPHLDFRFFKNGEAIDPLKVKAPPVEPVNRENKASFDKEKEQYLLELQQIQKNTQQEADTLSNQE